MSYRSRPYRGCSEQTISSLGGKSEVMKQEYLLGLVERDYKGWLPRKVRVLNWKIGSRIWAEMIVDSIDSI